MMKKIVATLLFSTIISATFAQDKKNVFQTGLGLGNTLDWETKTNGMPTLHFSYERILPFKAGPGFFGAGITATYRSITDDELHPLIADAPDYDWHYKNAVVAFRGAYHLSSDIIKVKNLDLYGALQLGARFYRVKYTAHEFSETSVKENSVHFSMVAGARYYFIPCFGVYSEVGYDVTWLKLGLVGSF